MSDARKVSVKLLVTACRMRIPVARDHIFIARTTSRPPEGWRAGEDGCAWCGCTHPRREGMYANLYACTHSLWLLRSIVVQKRDRSMRDAQVLVTGESGLGKTQLAWRVVHKEKIALNERMPLQAWLVGSSDDMFRRQLVAFFESWLPVVVQGCENIEARGGPATHLRVAGQN
jgi:hypothetical protein